ncbi:hypothetical protein QQ045_007127 [Rhodiola kirilowii]
MRPADKVCTDVSKLSWFSSGRSSSSSSSSQTSLKRAQSRDLDMSRKVSEAIGNHEKLQASEESFRTMQQEALHLASKALDIFDVTEATDITRFIKKAALHSCYSEAHLALKRQISLHLWKNSAKETSSPCLRSATLVIEFIPLMLKKNRQQEVLELGKVVACFTREKSKENSIHAVLVVHLDNLDKVIIPDVPHV